MPGLHRKMVTQEERATLSEGEGEGVAREAGRSERSGRGDWHAGCARWVSRATETAFASNGDSIREPDDGLMSPEELRPEPGEGVCSLSPRLVKYFAVQQWARM